MTDQKYQLTEYQADFVEQSAEKRIVLFRGGLQSGKSVSGAAALGDLIWVQQIQLPEQVAGQMEPEVWILSRSYALAETAWNYFRWMWGQFILTDKQCRALGLKRGDARTFWLHPGERPDQKPIRVRVRSTSDPEALRATANLIAAWADECAHWKDLAWRNLSGRGIVTPTRFLLTTTPRGKNWLYSEIYEAFVKGDPEVGHVHVCSHDSPWADLDYIKRLRHSFGNQYAAQELDADFTEFEGQVYTWDEREILCNAPPINEYDKIVHGIDPGYRDPYVVAFWGRQDGIWYLFNELYLTGHTTHDIIPLVQEIQGDSRVWAQWVDARKPEDVHVLRKAFPAKANRTIYAEKRKFQIRPGIQLCQWLLNEGRIKVDRTCSHWIEEAYKYSYPSRDERNRGENPVDFMNHHMDAMRYAMVSEEGRNFAGLHPRYRIAGHDQPVAIQQKGSVVMPTAEESLAYQDKHMDRAQRRDHIRSQGSPRGRRRARRRVRIDGKVY